MKINDNISDEYLLLFNAMTDTEEELSELSKKLVEAQLRAEEMYILAGAGHHHNMVNLPVIPHVDVKSVIKKFNYRKKLNVRHFICNHCLKRNACHI